MDEDAAARAERRRQITQDIIDETGITEEVIDRLVRHFYGKVRSDPLLGPIFEERISDWEPHLQRMCAFWSSVMLMTGRYHGQPVRAHLPLAVDADHFDHWLALFEESAKEVCTPQAAALFTDRAQRIAQSLELAIATQNGQFLQKGERYRRAAPCGPDAP